MMKAALTITAWTLRGSALICIVWTTSQVIAGQIATMEVLMTSVAFHAAFAVAGAQLAGFARGKATAVSEAATA